MKMRILTEAEKAAMRCRYANLSPEQRQAELDASLVRKRQKRQNDRLAKREEELARREEFLLGVDPVEVAWAAGFWEGEGSIGQRHANATQKNTWPRSLSQQQCS